MSRDRVAAGLYWEDAASDYLERHGLRTLLKRYRCRLGEIDLVCKDGATLVIVEVRARRTTHFASAVATIDFHKRRRIINATRHLLMRRAAWLDRPLRFDVVGIDAIESEQPRFEWIKNAFDAS